MAAQRLGLGTAWRHRDVVITTFKPHRQGPRPRLTHHVVQSGMDAFADTGNALISAASGDGAALLLLPALGGAALTLAAAKFAAYSQLEVVRTGMLGRHVRQGGARVLQLGGTTRDLFYYPPGTVQVTVLGPDISVSFWEQAGMQAQVPVRAVRGAAGASGMVSMAGGSVDSVVAFDQLSLGPTQLAAFLAEVYRVLKPGGTFVFIQATSGSPLAPLLRLGGSGGAPADGDIAGAVAELQQWDFVEWDVAVGALDPHAVGVAVKPLNAPQAQFASVDKTAFEQVMQQNTKKGKGEGGRKGFGDR